MIKLTPQDMAYLEGKLSLANYVKYLKGGQAR